MLDLNVELEKLGFEAETQDKDDILYVMDFEDGSYITVTDEDGRAPERAKANLILACYDDAGRYLWGSEISTFMALQDLCAGKEPGSPALLEALKNASKTLKDSEWQSPSRP